MKQPTTVSEAGSLGGLTAAANMTKREREDRARKASRAAAMSRKQRRRERELANKTLR